MKNPGQTLDFDDPASLPLLLVAAPELHRVGGAAPVHTLL